MPIFDLTLSKSALSLNAQHYPATSPLQRVVE